MVKTPPYQKRGKCGHFMPQFDSHLTCFGCRSKRKGQDPCAKGAKIDQCAACSALTEEQWIHLRECFSKRSSYRQRAGSHDESLEPEDEEPVFTGEDLGQVDDTLLDLDAEQTGNIAPVSGISPLNTQTSSASVPGMNFPATGPVQQSSDSSALFRAPDPVLTQDTLSTGQTPSRHTSRMSFQMPQPQRTATPIDIPQTPRTQLLKSHLEQQNFELMHKLQRKNEEQMRDISTQLQTGLQAFLQQSMENMFNRLAPAPAPQAPPAQPHIVSITPLSAVPAASKSEEPMDETPSQPPPAIKKGLANVKGSSSIASQSLQAVASQIQVPSVPTHPATAPPSAQPTVAPTSIPSTTTKLQSPLQILEQEEYGADSSASSFATSRPEEPTDTGEQAAPPNLPFRELVQKVREFLSIPDPASEEHYKPGSALGRDPLLLMQEKAGRPPSIKLPMVSDLSRLQTAQDEAVKPSTSSTLDIGKFPAIPPHKGSWYNVVDEKYSQTPQIVPQAFSNIAKPGYRSGPPATVQQKELVKLEYMVRENFSIANFLSTFGMASESCLNNLRVSRDQQEKLFDQLRTTQDHPTRDQILLQLYQITQQEAAQMQFMLDISRSMSKAYADLVANFISSLTNLVLLRRDAYLRHAHPNLDAFRLRNLRSATISGGDLFDRTLMQEYEQHLIGLGVKPVSKKDRFHPYKKQKRGRGGQRHAPQGLFYQPMPAPQYMVQQPFFPHPHQGGRRGGRGGRRGRGRGGNSHPGKQQQQPPQ